MKTFLKACGYAAGLYACCTAVLYTCIGLAHLKRENPDDLGEWLLDEVTYLFASEKPETEKGR